MSKIPKPIKVLGLSAMGLISTVSISGCSTKINMAQENIDNAVVNVLNSDLIQNNENYKFRNFTFLGADINGNGQNFEIDINGIATNTIKNKSYTTLNYVVPVFDFKYDTKLEKSDNNVNLINTLAEIVKNEQLVSYSNLNIKNISKMNISMAKITDSHLDNDYKCQGNFLYAVNNLSFNEQEQFASFTTKEFIKFTKMNVDYWAFTENGPIYTIDADRKSYFVDQNVYVSLTPEEIAQAKTDSSIVFSKFTEYVNNNENEKYVIEQTEMSENQELGVVMNEEVSLSNS